MRKIDNIIHWKLVEITIMLAVIMISYPLWKTLNIGSHLATAAFYEGATYTTLEVDTRAQGPMFPMEDEKAIQTLNPMTIKVKNDTLTKETYTLLLKVWKTSSLDYHCMNTLFVEEVKPLKDYFIYEDNDAYYFSLTTKDIIGETQEYNFLMWMDYQTGNEMQGKTLQYAFELQDGVRI